MISRPPTSAAPNSMTSLTAAAWAHPVSKHSLAVISFDDVRAADGDAGRRVDR